MVVVRSSLLVCRSARNILIIPGNLAILAVPDDDDSICDDDEHNFFCEIIVMAENQVLLLSVGHQIC